jgi:ATP-dependent Clp protease adaptor protein ClpS
MTDPGTVILEKPRNASLLATPWNVVLHDDPVNYMSYVTLVIQRVFGYAKTKAEKHMMEVHQLGRSVVWTGDREQAELYVHQLLGHHLSATMEKAGDES